METDDTKNFYEVEQEVSEYDGKDDFPQRPIGSLQIHDTISSTGKKTLFVLLGVQAFIILILIILLGINGVTLSQLNTVDMCDSTGASTGASTGTSGLTSSSLQSQLTQMSNNISQLFNMTRDSWWKINNIVDFTDGSVNSTGNIEQILKVTGESAGMLMNVVNTLSTIEGNSVTSSGAINDILLIVDQLLGLQNASSLFNSITPVSCKDIKAVLPNSPTGYYHVNSRTIYCNMDTLCNATGGWTRLAYLDMTDATQNCPSGFRYYSTGGVRACGRTVSNTGSCNSLLLPSNGITYNNICGRVTGYQYGSCDAFSGGPHRNDIDSRYVDGVSITRGSPRQHIWTFAAGVYQTRIHNSNCPCTSGTGTSPASFVGDNYFCESGNPNQQWAHTLYTADPLWDGQTCSSLEEPCCDAPGLPWFSRNFTTSSTQDLEFRICGDSSTIDEDSPVSMYEIYVM
uniref:Fibrinogen C-terminal domain-containing protein n=1 Tax=Amphimedon queenslandica TaxID=400682 RepID=A0A1X7SRR3_AMPQE